MIRSVLKYVSVFLFLFIATVVLAQVAPEDAAKKYGVAFPIAELGGCRDYATCRSFCDDPVNQNTCVAFAKQKGFYQEEKFDASNQTFWSRTKTELGCNSASSCQAFCEQPANYDTCNSFAKKQGLSGGHVGDPSEGQILDKAKQVLGCTSYDSCRSFCESPANAQKCSEFAKQTGLHGGVSNVGPGGCNSEETCRKFCSDPVNFKVCQGFSQSTGGRFTGPGGCNSEQSCRAYCEQHEDECRSIGGNQGGSYNPQEMCTRTPSCRWQNNTCECGVYDSSESQKKAEEYAEFCRKNPDKCAPGQQGSFQNQQERQQFEQYCSKNPEKCKSQSGAYDPARECAKYSGCSWDGSECKCAGQQGGSSGAYPTPDPASECTRYGCSWTGSSCQCAGSTGSSVPPPPPSGGSQPDPASACTRQAGCSWTGSTCQCSSPPPPASYQPPPQPPPPPPSGSQSDPATECAKVPGCSWTGSSCQCSGVQGAATQKGFFQKILEFLFGR